MNMIFHTTLKNLISSFFIILLIGVGCKAQQTQIDSLGFADVLAFQAKINSEFADREESPLTEKDFEDFKTLQFFPVDLKYQIMAKFIPIENALPFEMTTTTDRKPMYRAYGTLIFELDGIACRLTVYQNLDLMKKEEYKNYLFIPFTDLTNSTETYGGGRYLDLELPLNEEVLLDFNKAYNPYCAYNYKYSCPIPPMENDLNVFIKAGVKRFH